MNKKLFAVFAICVLAVFNAYSQTSTAGQVSDAEWQRILDRVNLLVDNHFENRDFDQAQNANWNITGLSVGIYKNGRTAFFNRGFHESERRNAANRRPVTENSIFLIGSISKPVSSIMLPYFSRINNPRTGRPYVNLNDPLNNYFETKPFIDTDGTRIYPTLLQLSTHYSGASQDFGGHGGLSYTLAQFRSMLQNFTYLHKPGTAYSYASGSTIVANVIASLYYGNDFPNKRVNDLLQEHLFSTLGMNSSKLHGWIDPALQDRMTLPHNFNGAAGSFRSVPTSGINLGGPSGCITSTAPDMIRLASFILGDNVPAGAEVLQQAAAAGIGWNKGNPSVPSTALTPHESNVSKMGAQFRELLRRPANSGQRYGSNLYHGGAIGSGHQAYIIMCPDTKTAVVVLSNTYVWQGSLAALIMDRALNATYSSQRTPFDDFDERIAAYRGANANVDIALNQDITIGSVILGAPARAGVTLTIRSANPARPVTLTRGISGNLFTVPNGVTLIFRDIIIDGGGSIISTDDEEYDEDGNQIVKPAVAGAIVRVNTGGTFIMNSGTVLRNNVNSGEGGGVSIAGGSFTMNGGEISGNTANNGGAISIWSVGKLDINDGKITGNTSNTNGGAISALGNSAVTVQRAEISGNRSNSGGAISIWGEGRLNINDVKITGNTANSNGGAIAASGNSAVTVQRAEISGNRSNNGGAISIWSAGKLDINDVKITGNIANSNGGAIAASGNSAVTVQRAEISGNTANSGGAIAVWGEGRLDMNDGKITGNTAAADGGGATVSGGTFTMSGGEISGNTTGRNGSGVRRSGGTFNLNGGVVAGIGAALTNVVSGTYNLNTAFPNNAVIIAWNRPSGSIPNYSAGTNTNLTVLQGATATWANQGGALGVSYTNGRNSGWIKVW